MTEEQLDELANRLLKKIAPKLGVELEEEEPKPDTYVRDVYNNVYDLDQCVTPCVIKCGPCYFLLVEEGIEGSEIFEQYWVSSLGDKFKSDELAYVLRMNNHDTEIIQG